MMLECCLFSTAACLKIDISQAKFLLMAYNYKVTFSNCQCFGVSSQKICVAEFMAGKILKHLRFSFNANLFQALAAVEKNS